MGGISTTIFVLRLLMMLFIGDDGFDLDADGEFDGDDSFNLLSFQSILAFFMILGWSGLALRFEYGYSSGHAILMACGLGFIAAAGSAWLMGQIKKLDVNPIDNRLLPVPGLLGKVYQTIPGKGSGLVKINNNGRIEFIHALSENKTEIPAFAEVEIVSVRKSNPVTLIVKQTN